MGSRFGRFRVLVVIGAVVTIALALIAVGHSSTSSSSSQSAKRAYGGPSRAERLAAAHRIETLYAGIPQHGEALGDPGAPVTLQFFGDLECTEARHFALGALPFIIRRWVRSGKLRILYRAFPAETVWPAVFAHQQKAALAAGEQHRLWQYLDFFYHRQGRAYTVYAVPSFLEGRAREVRGLDFASWAASRKAGRLKPPLVRDRRLAHAHGIYKTPAFLIGPTGGRARPLLHFSLDESRAFDEAVEEVLAGRA